MSFSAIRENKILAKNSESTVPMHVNMVRREPDALFISLPTDSRFKLAIMT